MNKKGLVKGAVGLVVVGGGLLYFGVQAIQAPGPGGGTGQEGVTTLQATPTSHVLSVTGRVKPGSIQYATETLGCTFTLLGGEVEIPVRYDGAAPNDLSDRQKVSVQGWLDADGVFRAQILVTPSSPRAR